MGELFESLRTARGALEDLFLRMLLVPVRAGPESSWFNRVAVPRQPRGRVEEILKAAPPPAKKPPPTNQKKTDPKTHVCPDPARISFKSREGSQRGMLLRFLLMAESERVGITRKGDLNRRDLARLARRAGPPSCSIEEWSAAATSA